MLHKRPIKGRLLWSFRERLIKGVNHKQVFRVLEVPVFNGLTFISVAYLNRKRYDTRNRIIRGLHMQNESKDRIQAIKQDFAIRSSFYDDYIVKVVPHHSEMLQALINSIPFSSDKPIRVLELGCGTGIATSNILERFPNAYIKCIDISQDMLDMAKVKFALNPNVEFEQDDYTKLNISDNFDVVISFLSMMYLTDDEARKRVFKKVYDILFDNGFFISGEVHFSKSMHYQEVCMEKWVEHMKQFYTDEFIEAEVVEKAKKHSNPSILIDELRYLKEIGFSQIDIIWKYYSFSVYGAIK